MNLSDASSRENEFGLVSYFKWYDAIIPALAVYIVAEQVSGAILALFSSEEVQFDVILLVIAGFAGLLPLIRHLRRTAVRIDETGISYTHPLLRRHWKRLSWHDVDYVGIRKPKESEYFFQVLPPREVELYWGKKRIVIDNEIIGCKKTLYRKLGELCPPESFREPRLASKIAAIQAQSEEYEEAE